MNRANPRSLDFRKDEPDVYDDRMIEFKFGGESSARRHECAYARYYPGHSDDPDLSFESYGRLLR